MLSVLLFEMKKMDIPYYFGRCRGRRGSVLRRTVFLCCRGLYLKVTGREVIHKNYGPQIQVDSYEEKQPKDSVAVERYLGSGAIKGVDLHWQHVL